MKVLEGGIGVRGVHLRGLHGRGSMHGVGIEGCEGE